MNRTVCDAILENVGNPYRLFCRLMERSSARRPFLLESLPPDSRLARWSFFGVDPFLTLRVEGTAVEETVVTRGGTLVRRCSTAHPLDALNERLDAHRAEPAPGVPSPFQGGAVGALAYDMGRLIEPVEMSAARDVPVPDLDVAFFGGVVAYEHATRRAYLLRTELPDAPSPDWLRTVLELANRPNDGYERRGASSRRRFAEVESTFTREAYRKAVVRAQDYIAAGDAYQINLTQRFSTEWRESPEALYANLRDQNPAPFCAYVELDGMTLLSSSPERFLRYDAATRRVETRPIKGTRPRGATPDEEQEYTRDLLASEKEAAELVMIVDLERNDLGRVCEYGSVHVPERRVVERYASVLHTVATVAGRLRRDTNLADTLRATFPGGSITGAPKIRAMEIIDELEPTWRGFYTGSLGYFGWNGNVDLNIAIRTFVLRDGVAYFGVGSGIVADSNPESEYDETLHKAKSLFEALTRS
jgi:para-aminobenzoate synthetase component 1